MENESTLGSNKLIYRVKFIEVLCNYLVLIYFVNLHYVPPQSMRLIKIKAKWNLVFFGVNGSALIDGRTGGLGRDFS